MDECKPLVDGAREGVAQPRQQPEPVLLPLQRAGRGAEPGQVDAGRGLHSSTFRLNVSAFYVTEGAFRGYPGGVLGVLGGSKGCLRCIWCWKWLRLS